MRRWGAGDKNMGDFEMLGFGGFFFGVFFLSLPPHGGNISVSALIS